MDVDPLDKRGKNEKICRRFILIRRPCSKLFPLRFHRIAPSMSALNELPTSHSGSHDVKSYAVQLFSYGVCRVDRAFPSPCLFLSLELFLSSILDSLPSISPTPFPPKFVWSVIYAAWVAFSSAICIFAKMCLTSRMFSAWAVAALALRSSAKVRTSCRIRL